MSRCNSEKVAPSGIFQSGEVSKTMGEIQGEMMPYCTCNNCQKLFGFKQN